MPPLSAYTPFESLLFFQSLATLAAPPINFAAISEKLCNNRFIRDNAAFDANRLSPQALEELYTTLLEGGLDSVAGQNGQPAEGANSNPKKRKIAAVRREDGSLDIAKSHSLLVPSLVTELYARYKERVTAEIRQEEKKYQEIQDEISRLLKEKEKEKENLPPATAVPSIQASASAPSEPAVPDAKDGQAEKAHPPIEVPAPVKPQAPATAPTATGPNVTPPGAPSQAPPSSAVPAPSAEASQGKPPTPTQPPAPALNVPPIPPPASDKPPTTTVPAQPPVRAQPARPIAQTSSPRSSGTSKTTLPPGSTIVFPAQQGTPMPSTPPVTAPRAPPAPTESASRKGPSMAAPTPSPMVHQYPAGQYQQWSVQATPQIAYGGPPVQAHGQNTNVPILERPAPSHPVPALSPHDGGRPTTHPNQPQQPLQPHGPMSPAVLQSGAPSPRSETPGHQTPVHPLTPSAAASAKRPARMSVDTSGSLTPWKRSPQLSVTIPQSPGSPARPGPEDVSPISDRAPSPVEEEPADTGMETRARKKRADADAERVARSSKRNVPSQESDSAKIEKTAPSARARGTGSPASTRSAGRSVSSHDEEAESVGAQRKVKVEGPAEDTEPETRTGTRRRAAPAATAAEDATGRARLKRKRAASETLESETAGTPGRQEATTAPQVVYCTRNFPRTSAPIMNDVTAHKHASIFAKPLTEREAPGYKDLIYRPQDLKSIKSAIHHGSKAVAAATEAASSSTPTAATEGESPAPAGPNNSSTTTTTTAAAPSKNTILTLPKTADLVPPKAIVNSAQLEKEIIRMFANAVMFNPSPEDERGFGPAFPMTSDRKEKNKSEPAAREESSQLWEVDEGGIVRDTREMCEDVEQAVTRWRAAERAAETEFGAGVGVGN